MNTSGISNGYSLKAYEAALASWLNARQQEGRTYRASTIFLYREMWGSFGRWCTGQNPPVALRSITKKDLDRFRQSRLGAKQSAISPLHALRLLRLIDKVLLHDASTEFGLLKTAADEAIKAEPDIRYAASSHAEPTVQVLNAAHTLQLMNHLSSAKTSLDQTALNLSWQSLRNLVSVSLQLGSGLGPAELRSLTMDCVVTGGRIEDRYFKLGVPAIGGAPAHEAPVAPWAAKLLQHWLQTRAELGIQGTWLFPSTRTGKQWGKVAQYNAAQQVFKDAGIENLAGGSFVLRHTFALRQLRHGTKATNVAKWMGVVDPKVMARYMRALQDLPDVV